MGKNKKKKSNFSNHFQHESLDWSVSAISSADDRRSGGVGALGQRAAKAPRQRNYHPSEEEEEVSSSSSSSPSPPQEREDAGKGVSKLRIQSSRPRAVVHKIYTSMRQTPDM